MLWLFVGPTGVYLLDFFCSSIQFNLLLSPFFFFFFFRLLIYSVLPCNNKTLVAQGSIPRFLIMQLAHSFFLSYNDMKYIYILMIIIQWLLWYTYSNEKKKKKSYIYLL